uniref:Uncharacterized protein n=1 Tax=Noctiluca scintillans TaxID=2966 RepID=A0A7S1B273_NOCSC|mmetsp:Transcript_8935/g.24906  ORF Transcript_8935/g.24906 Transcript_8935/m.24906 type:complete len:290 (+) Transcript_8935:111-980(+)
MATLDFDALDDAETHADTAKPNSIPKYWWEEGYVAPSETSSTDGGHSDGPPHVQELEETEGLDPEPRKFQHVDVTPSTDLASMYLNALAQPSHASNRDREAVMPGVWHRPVRREWNAEKQAYTVRQAVPGDPREGMQKTEILQLSSVLERIDLDVDRSDDATKAECYEVDDLAMAAAEFTEPTPAWSSARHMRVPARARVDALAIRESVALVEVRSSALRDEEMTRQSTTAPPVSTGKHREEKTMDFRTGLLGSTKSNTWTVKEKSLRPGASSREPRSNTMFPIIRRNR